ncbi:CaiB/BaiF CoA transferase family protein [Advenella kashmirensis]
MQKILSGTVVLDLTRFFSGPQATLLLAGLGAEVIKIDDPKTGDPTAFSPPFAGQEGVSFFRQTPDDMGIAYLKRARGKKSATLDLKSSEGKQLFMKLVERADVVIDNFSAGVADRLGIDYASLSAVNPKIIYCSLTGYGSTGADRDLKAYDLMVQAGVGLMSLTGHADGEPVKAGSPLSDAISGVFAAYGIVAALFHRLRTGQGQSIDVSMADCLFALMFDEPVDCYTQLGLEHRQGNRIMRFSPFNSYRTKDGFIALGAATNSEWKTLLGAMAREDLLNDGNMMNLGWRIAHNREVDQVVSEWTGTRATEELRTLLNELKIPNSPVRTIADVMDWRQLYDRDMIQPLWNPMAQTEVLAKGPGYPIKFSNTKAIYDSPAPRPGEHSREILRRLVELSDEEIDLLEAKGIT